MQYLWKKLLIISFLSNFLFTYSLLAKENNVSLLLLDKSSSSKYEIKFSKNYIFRDLSFQLIACDNSKFDKYVDEIALIKINQKEKNFIGWFFKYTDELNTYSNKIYEITLLGCTNKS